MKRREINPNLGSQVLAAVLATLVLTSVVSTGLAQASSEFVNIDEIARSGEWKALLHYRRAWWGREQSEIDDLSFFLSPTGKSNSREELEATLHAFRKVERRGDYDQHPQCIYPARFRFLKKALHLMVDEQPCPEFTKWKTALSVESISVVYAAPYLGNPASMFGHTFLRLNSKSNGLADASVSFDAVPSADGDLVFALKGITGGYRGIFSQQPFYSKVASYSHLENRDLWEFELSLERGQIDRLIEHLWELGATHFDYYFFDENCSYQLLSLLEAAEPAWSLRTRFGVMTVPLDTVRAVFEVGGIRRSKFRPALFTSVEARIGSFADDEREAFFAWIKKPRELTGKENAQFLDALLDWQKYQVSNRAEGGDAFDARVEERLLLARAKTASAAKSETDEIGYASPPMSPPISPLEAHRSSKVSLLALGGDDSSGFGVLLRPVLHDRLDRLDGYAPYTSLQMGEIELGYFPSIQRLRLDHLTLVSVENLQPWSRLRRGPSWKIDAMILRPADLRDESLAGRLSFGIGLSGLAFSDRLLIAGLIKLKGESSPAFVKDFGEGFRYGPALELLSIATLTNVIKIELGIERASYLARFDRSPRSWTRAIGTFAAALSARYEIRLQGETYFPDEHGSFTNLKFAVGRYF